MNIADSSKQPSDGDFHHKASGRHSHHRHHNRRFGPSESLLTDWNPDAEAVSDFKRSSRLEAVRNDFPARSHAGNAGFRSVAASATDRVNQLMPFGDVSALSPEELQRYEAQACAVYAIRAATSGVAAKFRFYG